MSGPPNVSNAASTGPAVDSPDIIQPVVGKFDAAGNVIQIYGPGLVPINLQGLTNPMTTAGDMIDGGTNGAEQRLGIGTTGQVLTVSAGAPTWQTPAFVNPMTTAGDLIDATTGGVAQRLAVGSNGQVLTVSGGLPTWAANAAMTNPMTTLGDVITGGSAGAAQRLAVGSNTQVLTVSGGVPTWQTPAASFANPMTTAGDLIDGGTGGAAQRLGIGSNNQILTVVSGAPAWAANAAMTNPMTTAGDIIDGGSSGTPQRLAIGSTGNVLTVSGGAPVWQAPGAAPNVNAQTGTTYTLVIGDAPQAANYQGIVTMNNGSANTLTIPANASVAFPVGTVIAVIQIGAGQTTIAITSDTLNNSSSLTARAQYSVLVLHKIATTTWVLGGDMT